MKRSALVIIVLIALGLLTWLLAGKPTAVNEPVPNTITYVGGGFIPTRLDLKRGETVTFINGSEGPMEPALGRHPDHGKYPGFPEEPLEPGEKFEFKFTTPGKWDFHDHLVGHNSVSITVSNSTSSIIASLPVSAVPQADGYYQLSKLGIKIETTPDLMKQELLAVESPNSPDTIFLTTQALKDIYPRCNGFNGAIATLTRMPGSVDSAGHGGDHEHAHGVFMKDVGDFHISYEVPYESCLALGGGYSAEGAALEYQANRAFYFSFIESAKPL